MFNEGKVNFVDSPRQYTAHTQYKPLTHPVYIPMTFSIVARCERTGQFASAVCSSSPSVAARCAYAQAGVGAATSQNVTDPRLGPKALELLASGLSASEAKEQISKSCEFPEFRQVTIVDTKGNTAIWSGDKTLGTSAEVQKPNVCSAGNMLASTEVPQAIVDSFLQSDPKKELGLRVIEAMEAGLAAGGEAGPVKSAGLVVVDKEAWPIADIRVDWSFDDEKNPLERMHGIWDVWAPQMHDYVTRCLNPTAAPSYGVPGDE